MFDSSYDMSSRFFSFSSIVVRSFFCFCRVQASISGQSQVSVCSCFVRSGLVESNLVVLLVDVVECLHDALEDIGHTVHDGRRVNVERRERAIVVRMVRSAAFTEQKAESERRHHQGAQAEEQDQREHVREG